MTCRNVQFSRPGSGFSLMEVLVATAIFSICTTAIFTAFQIGTRAFETGREATVTLQSLRFTIELLSRDLRSVYYQPDYQERFKELEKKLAKDKLGVVEQLQEEQQADPNNSEEAGYVGLKTNLRFRGQVAPKEFSHFEFARFTRERAELGKTLNDWGAERVHYFVAGDEGRYNLYRRRSPIISKVHINPDIENEVLKAADFQEQFLEAGQEDPFSRLPLNPRDLIGTGLLEPELEAAIDINYLVEKTGDGEPSELVVENIHNFKVYYGYYRDGTWVETSNWDSELRERRSPKFDVPTDDPDFLAKLLAYLKRPSDNLPAYVRIEIAIYNVGANGEGSSNSDISSMQTVIWMPNAIENFVPGDLEYFQSLEAGAQRN